MQRLRSGLFFLRLKTLLITGTIFLSFSFANASASAPEDPGSVLSARSELPEPAAEDLFGNDKGPGFDPGEPLLTIVYDAATHGEMFPCPT
jgi:hypothetical protein